MRSSWRDRHIQLLACAQLALAMALTGANVAVGKVIIAEIPIGVFSCGRFLLAVLVLCPFAISRPGRRFATLDRGEWRDVVLLGFFGIFLFPLLLLLSLRYTSATSAGFLMGALPAVIVLAAWLFLKERPGFVMLLAVAIAGLGIAVINTASLTAGPEDAPNPLFGNLLVIAAIAAEAMFTILGKRLSGRLDPLRIALAINAVGFVLFVPVAATELILTNALARLLAMPSSIWLLALYFALSSSVLAFVLWVRGVRHVSAAIAGLFTGLLPISAALVAVVFLGEALSAPLLLGGSCVLLAIVLGASATRQSA